MGSKGRGGKDDNKERYGLEVRKVEVRRGKTGREDKER